MNEYDDDGNIVTPEAPAPKDALAKPAAETTPASTETTDAPRANPLAAPAPAPETPAPAPVYTLDNPPAFAAGRQGIIEMYRFVGAQKGFAPHQIDGLVGNKIAESGLNPNAVNPRDNPRSAVHPDSIGFGQWNDRRAMALRRLAQERGVDWRDPFTQVLHTFNELDGVESRAGAMLRRARNVQEAAVAGIAYERPKGFSWGNPTGGHNWSGRLAAAVRLNGGNPYEGDTRDFAAGRASSPTSGGAARAEVEDPSDPFARAAPQTAAADPFDTEPTQAASPTSFSENDLGGSSGGEQEDEDNPFDNAPTRGVGLGQSQSRGQRSRAKSTTAAQAYAQRLAGLDTSLFGSG